MVRCWYTRPLATQDPRHSAALLQAELARVEREAAKTKVLADYQERKATPFLPATSEPEPVALRTPGWVRVPRHQDASAALEEAHPFMVEGSLRSDGMFVGQDLYLGGSVFYTPWVLCTLWIITPRIWCWHRSSDRGSHRWRNRSIRGRCRSGTASTYLATPRVNTRRWPN